MSVENSRPVWWYWWRIARFLPRRFALDLAYRTCWTLTFQAEGLLTREFLNGLTGNAPARFGIGSIIALLVAARLARIAILVEGPAWGTYNIFTVAGLLQHNLLARILERPGARPLPGSPGEAISRFRDDTTEVGQLMSDSLHLLGQFLFAGIALFVMLRIDARITVVAVLPMAAIIALAQVARNRIQRFRQANRQATGKVTSLIGEMFGAALAIQVAHAEEQVIDHFRTLNEARGRAAIKDRLLNELLGSVWQNTVNLGTGVVLLMAAESMRAQTFSIGDFALFIYYLGFVSQLLQSIGATYARYRQVGVSFQRMEVLLQGAPAETLVRSWP